MNGRLVRSRRLARALKRTFKMPIERRPDRMKVVALGRGQKPTIDKRIDFAVTELDGETPQAPPPALSMEPLALSG
jgi:hypothetical protein